MIRFVFLFLLCFSGVRATSLGEPLTLQCGETLAHSEYKTLHPFGGDKRLVVSITFAAEVPDPSVRNASIVEILINNLIPTAVSKDFENVSVWETKTETSTGLDRKGLFSLSVSAGAYENYDFTLGDEWIWEQTSGPDIDTSGYALEQYIYQENVGLYVSELYQREIGDRTYFEVWAHGEGAGPQEAVSKANGLFRTLSGCTEDGVPVDEHSFLGQQNALALRIYLVPQAKTSPLQYNPRLKLTYGHENGVATCYTMPANTAASWDEVYASLSE